MYIFENRIDIESKNLLEEYLNGSGSRTSGLSYSSLYMWRNENNFSFQEIEGYLCISGLSYLEEDQQLHFMFPPVSKDGTYEAESLRRCILKAKEIFIGKCGTFELRLVPEENRAVIEEAFPEMEWLDDRANYDYIYSRKEIEELRGKKFHAKKNFVNSFKKNYEYEYQNISSDMTDELMEFIDFFVNSKEIDEHDMMLLQLEYDALRDVFENFEAIGFQGGVIRIDGKVQAIAAGGIIGGNMVVEHIEKANKQFRGLYPTMLQEFSKHLPEEIEFINREEDMDIENLRKAKMSFKPCELAPKYIGRI